MPPQPVHLGLVRSTAWLSWILTRFITAWWFRLVGGLMNPRLATLLQFAPARFLLPKHAAAITWVVHGLFGRVAWVKNPARADTRLPRISLRHASVGIKPESIQKLAVTTVDGIGMLVIR